MDTPWEIPNTWAATDIGRIVQIVSGGTPNASDATNFSTENGVAWVTPADLSGYRGVYISHGSRHLSTKGYDSCSACLIPKGAVLFSSRAPVGYVAIASNSISTNQGFKSFVPPAGIDSRYLYYFLRHIKPIAEMMATGTTFKELSGAAAARLPLILAPSNEQKRIADKLDTLLARIDACRERLDRLPGLIKRFRRALLVAATTGQLTEKWRTDRSIADAGRLVQLSDVATGFDYGSAAKSSRNGAVPVLRMGNIQDGQLDWADLVYTSDEAEINRYRLDPGDVLFNRTNSPELVGKSAVYDSDRTAIFAGYLIRVRCTDVLLPSYLNYCLGSPAGRDYCWRVKSDGVSQSNINAKKLACFEFMLPSLEEQKEIMRRTTSMLKAIDSVDSRLVDARKSVNGAERAVLAKAFRGELVPQDTADEPAQALLDRLKSQPLSADRPKRGRRAVSTPA